VTTSGGNWSVYATITDTTSTHSGYEVLGIASFNLNVTGSGGVTVTSSTNVSPTATNTGFYLFSSNGTNGQEVQASQNTITGAGLLLGMGLSSGSSGSLTWSNPVLLATGTYTGSVGSLTAEDVAASLTESGFSLVYGSGGTPLSVSGGIASEGATYVASDMVTVPEPSTIAAFASGGLAIVLLGYRRYKRRRLSAEAYGLAADGNKDEPYFQGE